MRKFESAEVRLWMGVKSSRDGCWEWTGSLAAGGYGAIRRDGVAVGVHRYSWELHCGPIPPGMFVCHHCDNRSCVRPDHLFLGTHKDNMADMVRKNRSSRHRRGGGRAMGEANTNHKLTEFEVSEIRKACREKLLTRKELAAKYGIHQSLISYIVRRKTWAHVA